MYAEPNYGSKVLTRLNYNIVKLVRESQGPANLAADSWVKIQAGPRVGYLKRNFLRSPVDYRVNFAKKNGEWKLTFFVAGD